MVCVILDKMREIIYLLLTMLEGLSLLERVDLLHGRA